MERLNLLVEVVDIGSPKIVETRFGEAKMALAIVKDETGTINLKLWRDQVDLVKPGDVIQIFNGFAVLYGGKTEINVGSKGRITVIRRKRIT
jgi:replication factor A1